MTILLASAGSEKEVVSALYDLIHLRCYWSMEAQLLSILQDFVTSHPQYCDTVFACVAAYMGDTELRHDLMKVSSIARAAGLKYGKRTPRPLVIGPLSGEERDEW